MAHMSSLGIISARRFQSWTKTLTNLAVILACSTAKQMMHERFAWTSSAIRSNMNFLGVNQRSFEPSGSSLQGPFTLFHAGGCSHGLQQFFHILSDIFLDKLAELGLVILRSFPAKKLVVKFHESPLQTVKGTWVCLCLSYVLKSDPHTNVSLCFCKCQGDDLNNMLVPMRWNHCQSRRPFMQRVYPKLLTPAWNHQ